MQISQIGPIIKKGEGIRVEFKECRSKLSKTVFETICAFLNRSGGELLLGVNDEGRVTGIEKERTARIKKEFAAAVMEHSGGDPELIEEEIFRTKIPLGRRTAVVPGLSRACPRSVPSDIAADIMAEVFSPVSVKELMRIAGSSNRTRFRDQILRPFLEAGLIRMTLPDKASSPEQKYVITDKARKLLEGDGR